MKIDVIWTRMDLHELNTRNRDGRLREAGCVVFDVLRATSTFVTALHNGAKEIYPTYAESLAEHHKENQPEVLLGGERHGVKIRAFGRDYDFGNSPREYTPEKVKGQTIVSTTTNGTGALLTCSNAKIVLAGAFLNLEATANFLRKNNFENVLLVCAGTGWNTAFEDVLGAGALCEKLLDAKVDLSDSAQIALTAYNGAKGDLLGAVSKSENARRLLSIPELRDDVPFCLQRDIFDFVAVLKHVPSWGPALSILVEAPA
jgi:2-phosphosulfolactate phosphatase